MMKTSPIKANQDASKNVSNQNIQQKKVENESSQKQSSNPFLNPNQVSTNPFLPKTIQMKKEGKQDKEEKNSNNQNSSETTQSVQTKAGDVLGEDFSDVKITENSKAKDLDALAYTQGNEITFAPGQLQPQNKEGQSLLAHELAHVKQQRQGNVKPTIQTKGLNVNDDSQLEQEADNMSEKIVQHQNTQLKTTEQASLDTSNDVIQKKDVALPEKLGSTQSGPIAQKGVGDAHPFSVNDVNQGSIGDCYFLASLVAVANSNPNHIKNAIKDNKNGTYTVNLFTVKEESSFIFWKKKVFTPVNVVLYPTFPIAASGHDAANPNASDNPAHAHGGDKDASGNTELWVRLIEKAYALLMGSYKAIGNGGFGANALEVLLGKPYQEEVLGDSYKKRILEMYKENIPIEVATFKDTIANLTGDLQTFARNNSIVGGHSYAVMYADDTKIRVRNPWGTGARNAEPEMTWDQFKKLFHQYSNRQ